MNDACGLYINIFNIDSLCRSKTRGPFKVTSQHSHVLEGNIWSKDVCYYYEREPVRPIEMAESLDGLICGLLCLGVCTWRRINTILVAIFTEDHWLGWKLSYQWGFCNKRVDHKNGDVERKLRFTITLRLTLMGEALWCDTAALSVHRSLSDFTYLCCCDFFMTLSTMILHVYNKFYKFVV